MPQPPQWLALFCVLVSQPFFGSPSQSPKPELQTGLHTPLTQEVLPLGLVHTVPHPPQWLGLVIRYVSQPFNRALPSQLPQPAAHAIEQAPAAHCGVPLVELQITPHAPQFATLVCRSVSQPFEYC